MLHYYSVSFIHLDHLYSTSSSPLLLRGRADVIVSAAARRSILVSGGPKNRWWPENILFYPYKFLMTFFSHLKLQLNKCTATKASAAARRLTSGAAGTQLYSEALLTQHGYCSGISCGSAPGNCKLRTCPRLLSDG